MNFYEQVREQIILNVTNPKVLGCTVQRLPVTKKLDNTTGDATYTEGTAENIDVYFTVYRTEQEIYKEGVVKGANAHMMTTHLQEIKRDDVIIFNDLRFRVDTVTPRYVQGYLVSNDCNLIYIGDV